MIYLDWKATRSSWSENNPTGCAWGAAAPLFTASFCCIGCQRYHTSTWISGHEDVRYDWWCEIWYMIWHSVWDLGSAILTFLHSDRYDIPKQQLVSWLAAFPSFPYLVWSMGFDSRKQNRVATWQTSQGLKLKKHGFWFRPQGKETSVRIRTHMLSICA